jgi:hypothetical protein
VRTVGFRGAHVWLKLPRNLARAVAELLPVFSGTCRAPQAAGQANAKCPEMVCNRRDRADEQRRRLVEQGHSDRGKADSGDEQKAKGQGTGSGFHLRYCCRKFKFDIRLAPDFLIFPIYGKHPIPFTGGFF